MYKYNGFLINEQLRKVDPRSSNLTAYEKRAILKECKINSKYLYHAVFRLNGYSYPIFTKIYVEGMSEHDNSQ